MTMARELLAIGSLALLLVNAAAVRAADTRTVTDSTGRRVEVPVRIERVFPAGSPAGIFLYTLAPEKMLGTASRCL